MAKFAMVMPMSWQRGTAEGQYWIQLFSPASGLSYTSQAAVSPGTVAQWSNVPIGTYQVYLSPYPNGPFIALPGLDGVAVSSGFGTSGDPWFDVLAYGAIGDGVNNDTTGIAAAITACPPGGTVFFPTGIYKFSTLTINKAITLRGAGWMAARDSAGLFGSANYSSNTLFQGSVLRSTATSGVAISCTGFSQTTAGLMIANLALIGPGSGTSTGLQIGDNVQVPVDVSVRRVAVMNFAVNCLFNDVEEGVFDRLFITGSGTDGIQLSNHTNNCTFILPDFAQNANGINTTTADCYNNVFIGIIVQNGSGTAMILRGSNHTVMGGFFEQASGVRALDIFSVGYNTVQGCFFNFAADSVRIDAASSFNLFLNCDFPNGPNAFVNNGVGTIFIGDTTQITFSGTGTKASFWQGGQFGVGTISPLLNSVALNAANAAAANDADANVGVIAGGADVTLGALLLELVAHPSAVGTNRFNAIRSVDNSNFRTLKLNDTGGAVQLASAGAFTSIGGDLRRSRQTPSEGVLVSGVDATQGELIGVTLTAARLVGAPLNPAVGQRLTFTLIQGGVGAFAVTWNAVFKKTWSDAGNATGARSTISYVYDGTNWNQDGAQAPYV